LALLALIWFFVVEKIVMAAKIKEEFIEGEHPCECCGDSFWRDQHWKKTCLPCWKKAKLPQLTAESASQAKINELESENRKLWAEVQRLRKLPQLDGAMLKRLLQLSHPDKHGQSEASHTATLWLLSQRGNAA
jgi:hypothetical protein